MFPRFVAQAHGTLAIAAALLGGVAAAVRGDPIQACQDIQAQLSSESAVISDPSNANFKSDIQHYFQSEVQVPACVLEAGSAEDIAVAMRVIGAQRTPFAVASGGFTHNEGFSSTPGVFISLARMKKIVLSQDNSTVEIGMGQKWGEVFRRLEGTGYNVPGGQFGGPNSGIGVGGYTLSGGYGWKTNQFGLASDTVKQFNIVLPDGAVTFASADENSDVFFALKGGLNHFGIVTSAVFTTHPQPDLVFGGARVYPNGETDALLDAVLTFSNNNKNPKAAITAQLVGTPPKGRVFFFYDGQDPGDSFSMFDKLTASSDDTAVTPFTGFISKVVGVPQNRGGFASFSTSGFTEGFLRAMKAEAESWPRRAQACGGPVEPQGPVEPASSCGTQTTAGNGTTGESSSFAIQPWLDYGKHATDSAFPHYDSPKLVLLYAAWDSADDDEFYYASMKSSIASLKDVAIKEGLEADKLAVNPGFALTDTPPEQLFGKENAVRLISIRDRIDPSRVMDLTRGFI